MRLDDFLIEQKLCKDIVSARGLIMSAKVLVNDEPICKTGYFLSGKEQIRIRNVKKWVSRGGDKLADALDSFGIQVSQKKVIDIGASTGGFSDVLLTRNVSQVLAVDVGYGILHTKIRNDVRVFVKERTHICKLSSEELPFIPNFFVMDLSFINPIRVMSYLVKTLFKQGIEGVVLFKPQFYVAKESLMKGIVKDALVMKEAIKKFELELQALKVLIIDSTPSSLKGADGNQEYLYYIKWS